MPRLKLQLPARLPFLCSLPIRITDLNYGAHLGNDKVLSLMHEARAQYFTHYGYAENSAEGTSFIMGDCAILYKSEGFYGQVLRCEVGAGDYTRAAFDIYYRFIIEGSEKLLVEAKTGLVCFNYETRKVQPVPDALRLRLGDAWEAGKSELEDEAQAEHRGGFKSELEPEVRAEDGGRHKSTWEPEIQADKQNA